MTSLRRKAIFSKHRLSNYLLVISISRQETTRQHKDNKSEAISLNVNISMSWQDSLTHQWGRRDIKAQNDEYSFCYASSHNQGRPIEGNQFPHLLKWGSCFCKACIVSLIILVAFQIYELCKSCYRIKRRHKRSLFTGNISFLSQDFTTLLGRLSWYVPRHKLAILLEKYDLSQNIAVLLDMLIEKSVI